MEKIKTNEEINISNLDLLKILFPFIKKYKLEALYAFLLLPLGAFAFSIQPIILQRAIDGPLKDGDLMGLTPHALVLAIVIAVHFLIQVAQALVINSAGQKMVADIRSSLFAHVQKLSMSFFDKNPIGKIVTRITNDLEQLGESFAAGLITSAADIINILGIIAFMFYLNYKLCLVLIAFLVPMILSTNYYQNYYRKSNLEARKELSKLNSFLQQNIVGISVVQLLNSTEKNMRIFDENNKKFFKANDNCIKADSSFSAAIEFFSLAAIAVLIYFSKYILKFDGLSIGVIIAFLQYAQYLFDPIRNISDKFTMIQSGFTAAERVSHLINEPIEVKDPATNTEKSKRASLTSSEDFAKEGSELIQSTSEHSKLANNKSSSQASKSKEIIFKDVWFKYSSSDDWILKGLNFKINSLEKVAVIGKTGEGKSTIIKLLARLYEPQEGEILIDGINIKDIKQDELRSLIAIIHQESYIFAGDVESNITLNRDPDKIDLELANPFLEAFTLSLDTELQERAANISAGEEQVISFARAVVSDPEILILDEATAKIDLKTEKIIQESLEEFMKNRTSIVIAHRLETIKKMDRVLELSDGKIIRDFSPEELKFNS